MRALPLILIILLNWCASALAAPAVNLLDITEQQGPIAAHFSLSGATLVTDETGTPQLSPVDQLEARLTVSAPESYRVVLPTFSAATFGDFTLLEHGTVKRQRTEQLNTSTSWLIEPYNPGEYTLPPLTISATKADGSSQTLTLILPPVTVVELPDKASFDLLPPRPQTTKVAWLTPLLWGLAGIIILVLLVLLLKRKKRPRRPSPKQRALNQIEHLTGTGKEQSQALSRICRQFLDENFGLRTSEKTYGEYAPFIKKHPQIQNSDALLRVLQRCDQYNYTSQPAGEDELAALKQETQATIADCAEPLRPDEDPKTCGRW